MNDSSDLKVQPLLFLDEANVHLTDLSKLCFEEDSSKSRDLNRVSILVLIVLSSTYREVYSRQFGGRNGLIELRVKDSSIGLNNNEESPYYFTLRIWGQQARDYLRHVVTAGSILFLANPSYSESNLFEIKVFGKIIACSELYGHNLEILLAGLQISDRGLDILNSSLKSAIDWADAQVDLLHLRQSVPRSIFKPFLSDALVDVESLLFSFSLKIIAANLVTPVRMPCLLDVSDSYDTKCKLYFQSERSYDLFSTVIRADSTHSVDAQTSTSFIVDSIAIKSSYNGQIMVLKVLSRTSFKAVQVDNLCPKVGIEISSPEAEAKAKEPIVHRAINTSETASYQPDIEFLSWPELLTLLNRGCSFNDCLTESTKMNQAYMKRVLLHCSLQEAHFYASRADLLVANIALINGEIRYKDAVVTLGAPSKPFPWSSLHDRLFNKDESSLQTQVTELSKHREHDDVSYALLGYLHKTLWAQESCTAIDEEDTLSPKQSNLVGVKQSMTQPLLSSACLPSEQLMNTSQVNLRFSSQMCLYPPTFACSALSINTPADWTQSTGIPVIVHDASIQKLLCNIPAKLLALSLTDRHKNTADGTIKPYASCCEIIISGLLEAAAKKEDILVIVEFVPSMDEETGQLSGDFVLLLESIV